MKNEQALRTAAVEDIVFHHHLDAAMAQAHPPVERKGDEELGKGPVHGARGHHVVMQAIMYQRCARAP